MIFAGFAVSCASTTNVQQKEAFSAEEESDFFSDEEDVFEEELEEPVSSTAENDLQQEEKEAESELEGIEGEFAEFIEEEEEDEKEETEPAPEVQEEMALETPPESSISAEDNIIEENIADSELPAEEPNVVDELPNEPIAGAVDEPIADDFVETAPELSGSNTQVTDIRYEQGQVFIDTVGGELSYRSRFNSATRQQIIEISQAVIIDQLKWPYIMKEFQSHFALLQADQKTDDTVRVVIQMRPESTAPTIVQKEDNSGLIISGSVTDLTNSQDSFAQEESFSDDNAPSDDQEDFNEEETFAENEADLDSKVLGAETIYDFLLKDHKFYGNRITLDVRDAKLKDILYFLAEDTGINMIISDKISDSEKINVRLKNIPWDQALILIMKRKQLAYVRRGSVITIAALAEFEAEQQKIEQFVQQKEASAPLKLEIVPIAYAKVSSLMGKISIFKTPKGKVELDTENNSLVIYDTETALKKMKALIQELDRTPKQVMIAAKIVEVTENFTRSFGINWGFTSGSPFNFSIGPLGRLEIGSVSPLSFLSEATPASGTIGSHLRIGSFPFFGDLDARFGIEESEGTARVLASPRIIALNGKSANVIQQTESISFSSNVSEGGTISNAVEKSPLSLALNVTPNITNVNSVYMRISMNRSFEGARVSAGTSSAAPSNSRSANTEILVKSGQTAVIGGIYETRESKTFLGFPILKYIPLVKWLFSQTNSENSKTELLLFLTPRIINIDDESQSEALVSAGI